MLRRQVFSFTLGLAILGLTAAPNLLNARVPIRSAFFSIYPTADNTQIEGLPSDSKHCGVCHFDFSGGGPRNPYGLGVEIGIGNGLSNSDAILALEGLDSDGDGFSNLTEITSVLFTNTPTFPGLTGSNANLTLNIPIGEITPYLTPEGSSDTTPPLVTVLSPNGGETFTPGDTWSITYTATDASGIDYVNVYLSDDLGLTYKAIALNAPDTGSVFWYVPNLPATQNLIKVEAVDLGGNPTPDRCCSGPPGRLRNLPRRFRPGGGAGIQLVRQSHG